MMGEAPPGFAPASTVAKTVDSFCILEISKQNIPSPSLKRWFGGVTSGQTFEFYDAVCKFQQFLAEENRLLLLGFAMVCI